MWLLQRLVAIWGTISCGAALLMIWCNKDEYGNREMSTKEIFFLAVTAPLILLLAAFVALAEQVLQESPKRAK